MSQTARQENISIFPFGMRSDRLAVSTMFLVNGMVVGAWSAKIPALVARLGINESVMGTLVIVFGLGSILLMPVFGALIARYGSDRMLRRAAIPAIPVLLILTLAPDVWWAGAALLLFGGIIGGMDVAMNANAVEVEKHMRRAIMSACHGFWSLGGLIGAGTGGVLIAYAGEFWHAVIVTVVAGALVLFALPMLARDRSPSPDAAPAERGLPRSPLPYLIGLMALFAMIPEGSVLDWGGLFLNRELGADLAVAGWAFAGFSATMAVMRFAGDGIRRRLGAVNTLRICAVFAIAGLVVAGLATGPYMAIAGFAIAGIGMSNLVPILFSAAGNLPGVPPGIGLSVVTVMGYSGILLAPGLIGYAAEHTGFSPIYLVLASLLLVTLAAAPLARGADFNGD